MIESLHPFFRQPFIWGLAIGLFFMLLSLWFHWKTKREFSRYKKMLGDKLELDSAQQAGLHSEKDKLSRENENLRMQVKQLNEKPELAAARELEIMSRAQRSMVIKAPGFAQAWETAKQEALDEIVLEEKGKSLPKRIMSKFFGGQRAIEVHDSEEAAS